MKFSYKREEADHIQNAESQIFIALKKSISSLRHIEGPVFLMTSPLLHEIPKENGDCCVVSKAGSE